MHHASRMCDALLLSRAQWIEGNTVKETLIRPYTFDIMSTAEIITTVGMDRTI